MLDYQWKDLKDAQISENVFPATTGSTLTFIFQANSENLLKFPEIEIVSKA